MIWAIRIEQGPHKGQIYSISDCKVRALHFSDECARRVGQAQIVVLKRMPRPSQFYRPLPKQ